MAGHWKYLIHVGIGLVLAFLIAALRGLFSAAEASAVMMALCDGFFVAGALLLGWGGLRWTYNGGAMDGLGFAFKTFVARLRRDFEENRPTFAKYRQEREAKALSPKWLLLSGLTHLGIAAILMAVYLNL